jgi:hypothetical protein
LALLDRSVPHDAARLLHRAGIIALLDGAVMTVAYAVMTGKTFRGLNLRDPYDEGLSIDGLPALVTLGLVATRVAALRGQVSTPGARR